MSLIAVPNSSPQGRKWALRIGAPVVALGIVLLVWGMTKGFSGSSKGAIGQFFTAVPMDLDIKINKDGELAALNNIEISSEVEGLAAIQTIVLEGSNVKQGDVLVTLDSSTIKQKIEDTTLDLQKAEADLTTSKEMRDIQESQNSANLEAAEVALILAKLDLQAYTEGIYPQSLQDAQTALEMAKITFKNRQEDLSQTKGLFGKGFVTASDVKKSELDLTTATNEVARATSALKVLTEYTHQKDMADKKNALSQAEQKLVRTKRENAAIMSQKNADVGAKTQGFEVIKRRMEHLQDQFAACTIKAPADGMVVYASSGDRFSDNRIQEGASVRERQTLLRLPDTSAMKVTARINESQVGKLNIGMRARVRIGSLGGRTIGATVNRISVLADSGGRFFNPDLKEYPVDLVLDETPKSLKPGMGANCEVLVNHLANVVAVPLSAIYSAGSDAYVFVRDGENVKPAKIRIGQSNETHAQIREGLDSGAQVLLLQAGQGRELLEQAGIKIEPTTRGSEDFGQRRGGGGGGNGEGRRNRNGGGGGGGEGANARPDGTAPGGAGPNGAGPNGIPGGRPEGALPGVSAPGADASQDTPRGERRRRDANAPTTGPVVQ